MFKEPGQRPGAAIRIIFYSGRPKLGAAGGGRGAFANTWLVFDSDAALRCSGSGCVNTSFLLVSNWGNDV